VELFAGAGGLALGTAQAGFRHAAVLEWDKFACETLRHNKASRHKHVKSWNIVEGDVADFDYSSLAGKIQLVAGGPPCQPFSLGGRHRGNHDSRNMFPEAVRAVREVLPDAFIFENVKGLLRPTFEDYYEYIIMQMRYPELLLKSNEGWAGHNRRLLSHHKRNHSDTHYIVEYHLLNAADFGVPQCRERVFIVGFRSDLGAMWEPPAHTHSHAALLRSQADGDYWENHKVPKAQRTISGDGYEDGKLPWRTVRDAIRGLPDPRKSPSAAAEVNGHRFQPGAKSYPGHTGSPLDRPGKTLKAGVHGVPGGENMILFPDGSLRYLTVRESARMQTFDDTFAFHGTWTESMRQLGNAVPVDLAKAVVLGVRKSLEDAKRGRTSHD
jgi:DNA (cytosine-5)-methyltransferase 1